ncbi:Arm DNA-binding domain-containing protein [Sphingobium sp. SCG-1]|uniref:Arm DNA-binding domain-containing protein n=1 Tax=Sphingobium sp. SCG-1 TaxID=2072936 RepID=UPI003983B074
MYKNRRNLGLLCPRLSRFDHLFPAASVPCGGLSRGWSVPGISRSPQHRGLLRKKALDHGTYRHCNLKRKAPGEVIQEGDSLVLFVQVEPTGGKLWRFKYRMHGRERKLAIGTYPAIHSLEGTVVFLSVKSRHYEFGHGMQAFVSL